MIKLLLIDDDARALELRALIFQHHGFETATAVDCIQARALFVEFQPHAVLLDLRLPSAEDGRALIREFRKTSPPLRIVVLAGWPADLEGSEEAAMVDAVFAKPASPALLVQAVKATR